MKISLYTKVLTYLNPSWSLSTGMVVENGTWKYLVSARNANQDVRILSYGEDINTYFLATPPMVVNTTLTDTKVAYFQTPLHSEDPEQWLDRNEARVVPPGYTSDQVINEWDVQEDHLFAATVTEESLNKVKQTLTSQRFIIGSLAVPLWDLAILYGKHLNTPFIIWKINDSGSLLGHVEQGKLQNLAHFWPDYEDLHESPEAIAEEMNPFLQSLIKEKEVANLIPIFSKEDHSVPPEFAIPGFNLEKPPTIEAVPVSFHEAYACSLHQQTHLDFTQITDTHQANALDKKRRRFLSIILVSLLSTVGLVILFFINAGIISAIQNNTERQIRPLSNYVEQIKTSEKRLDSLKNLYTKKALFLNRETIITFLLTEMQVVFPDGVWAEQITISEIEENQWQVDIIALAYSTALIPQVLSKLEQVDGINNVRMIYSEQTETKKKKRVIKCKLECQWQGVS